MCSIMSEKPGPEVTVNAFAPPHTPPCSAIEAASSSSIWMKHPPTVGTRKAKRSTISVDGVIGYPAANLAPAASAPSQQAWSPSIKCVPVSTPRGSAFMDHLLRGVGLHFLQLRNPLPVNREVRAVHPAQIAAAALLRRHHVWRMVALGIEGRRQGQHFRGTKLHAKAASLAPLHNNRNASFCHGTPTVGKCWALPNLGKIMVRPCLIRV